MNRSTKVRNVAAALFAAASVLFLVFFVYMALFENVAVYSARDSHSYTTITGFSVEQIADESAPAGVRTIYRWKLDSFDELQSCLCFYMVHQHAQIYYDDELIYSMTADDNNRIGGSIGSNWVSVPLYPEDSGKELTVVLTPLFESMVGFTPQFLIGSRFSIMMDQLFRNLPQLLISAMCVLVGLFIIAVQLYLTMRGGIESWNMVFMGAFAILLGLWQMTGSISSPLLFPKNPMVLGYITIGVLFLCPVPLLLFASSYFHGKKAAMLRSLAAIDSMAAVLVLLLQVLGVADFKETLVVSHVMLIVAVCAIAAAALFRKKGDAGRSSRKSWKLLLLPGAGIVIDMVLFYISDSSSDLFFMTLITFIVYALITFISNILETIKKAYTDANTGLTNKTLWNELMTADTPVDPFTAIMMLDLNGLKPINDTYGHEAGDKMILNFSNILRRSLPNDSIICRWGGDEFAVLINRIGKSEVEKYLSAIRQAVHDHNIFCSDLPIFYAVGWVLSSDYPGLSRKELLNEADRQMYLNKKQWYSEHQDAIRR